MILEEEGKKKTRKMSWVIREEKRNPEARIGLFPSLFLSSLADGETRETKQIIIIYTWYWF